MSPRTGHLPLVVGALLLSASCGAPPEALPTSPPLPRSSAGMPAGGAVPSVPLTLPPMTTPPTPGYTTMPPRTVPTTVTPSPSPTPSHAPRCTGEPTAAQIVTLLKDNPAVPDRELTVVEGPYCAGKWSFTTVSLGGAESAEPLSVVTTGKGAALTFVTAGTDVCNPRVKAEAPAGIRVLACGE